MEAEVRYGVRYEYAQTAIDFLARRSRLAFLNAQAALDSLPRVISIMAAELGWSRKRIDQELRDSVAFLQGSMGLVGASQILAHRSWTDWLYSQLFGYNIPALKPVRFYSRAQFEAGEIESLKSLFFGYTEGKDGRLSADDLRSVLAEVPGYEKVWNKEVAYVLDEAGLSGRQEFDFEEFVEVCSMVLSEY